MGRPVSTTRQIDDGLIQFRDPYGRVTGFARRNEDGKSFTTTDKWGRVTGTVKEEKKRWFSKD